MSILFENEYECPCGTNWTDFWVCMVDDECPTCGLDIEPSSSIPIEVDKPTGGLAP